MVRVVNVRGYRPIDGEVAVYIARPPAPTGMVDASVLGNPYRIGSDGTREQVIERYRQGLLAEDRTSQRWTMVRKLKTLAASQDIALVCFCAPLACHGDTLKELIEGKEPNMSRSENAARAAWKRMWLISPYQGERVDANSRCHHILTKYHGLRVVRVFLDNQEVGFMMEQNPKNSSAYARAYRSEEKWVAWWFDGQFGRDWNMQFPVSADYEEIENPVIGFWR